MDKITSYHTTLRTSEMKKKKKKMWGTAKKIRRREKAEWENVPGCYFFF